jgi:signal transduction histidine kinase
VHLARLVDDLLSYSRLSAGQISLDVDEIPLADILRGLTDLVGPQALARSISLDELACSPEIVVLADPERVRQIVLNLLGNAVKFSPPGTRVQVAGRAQGSMAIVEVSDNGPGIPPDKLDAIFEPFVRLAQNADTSALDSVSPSAERWRGPWAGI